MKILSILLAAQAIALSSYAVTPIPTIPETPLPEVVLAPQEIPVSDDKPINSLWVQWNAIDFVTGDILDDPEFSIMQGPSEYELADFNVTIFGQRVFDGDLILVNLPNFVDREPVKFIDISLHYFLDPITTISSDILFFAFDTESDVSASEPRLMEKEFDPRTGLVWEKWKMELYPNPDWELLDIFVPGNIAALEIHTQSIPEPSAAGLLGLVILLAARRRK